MSLRERRSHGAPAGGGAAAPQANGGYSGYSGYPGYGASPTNSAQQYQPQPQQYQQPQPQQQPQYGGYPQASSSSFGVSSGSASAPTSGGGGGAHYGGYGSSALSGDESKHRKKGHGTVQVSGFGLWIQITVILTVVTFCFFGATLHYRSRYHHHKKHHHAEMERHAQTIGDHTSNKFKVLSELQEKNEKVSFLEDRLGEMQKELGKHKSDAAFHKVNSERVLEKQEDREEILMERIERMIKSVRRESRRETIERFGKGPHQVEIQFELPHDQDNYPNVPENPSIHINLYTDDMPHAVHLFLEQIAHELWDGCAFYINAEHVFQAGAWHAKTGHEIRSKFEERELDSLSYQEYSEDHPHDKYTIGFAGRPAGPEFYINKQNNNHVNGPGGQIQQALHEEADPCFGEVDEHSIAILERLFQLPIDDHGDILAELEAPLMIKKATIVGWIDPEEVKMQQDEELKKMKDAMTKAENGQQQQQVDNNGGNQGQSQNQNQNGNQQPTDQNQSANNGGANNNNVQQQQQSNTQEDANNNNNQQQQSF